MSWYDDLIGGRGEFGSLGFSVGDALSPWYANTRGQLDPRLAQLGYSQYFNPGDESGGSQLTAPQGYGQGGQIMIHGVPHVQVSRGAAGIIKDPSRVTYDDKYGAITPQENYNLQDSPIDRLVGGATQAIAIGAPLAFMGGLVPGVEGLLGGTQGAAGVGANWAQGGGFGAGGISPETALGAGGMGSGAAGAGGALGAAGAGDAAGVAGGSNWAAGGGFGAGGISPETALGAGGMGSGGGFLSSALNWAMNNPVQAAGALYSASGLLGGGNQPSGSTGGGGSSNIGLLDPQAFQRPEWKPNANTLAQLNALYGGRYGG